MIGGARLFEAAIARCGGNPPYGEREIFFDRYLCGWCAHMVDKDD